MAMWVRPSHNLQGALRGRQNKAVVRVLPVGPLLGGFMDKLDLNNFELQGSRSDQVTLNCIEHGILRTWDMEPASLLDVVELATTHWIYKHGNRG